MKPQCSAVLRYLEKHGSITPLDALKRLGIMRLGARAWDLKQHGFPVVKQMVRVRTRDGVTHVARYSLA